MFLEGNVAMVTGGGSGIGQAACLLLAREGAAVAVGDIVHDAARATAGRITAAGGRAIQGRLDATDATSVAAFVGQTLSQFGRVDILVNNVGGIDTHTSILDSTEPDWDTTFARNVKSVFYMSRAVLPSMMQNGSGSVINIGSVVALVGRKHLAAYSAAKGAIVALTRAMAHDYGPYHIRVNCVCPGPTLTPALHRALAEAPDPEAKRKAREAEQPLGRLGEASDIGEAIVFLASDRASWITGAILPVDGGNSAI